VLTKDNLARPGIRVVISCVCFVHADRQFNTYFLIATLLGFYGDK
jgi:hypothetical protein